MSNCLKKLGNLTLDAFCGHTPACESGSMNAKPWNQHQPAEQTPRAASKRQLSGYIFGALGALGARHFGYSNSSLARVAFQKLPFLLRPTSANQHGCH